MTRVPNPSGTPTPPPLTDLLAHYLQRQAAAHADGLALGASLGEVVPFEAAPVQPVDPRLAWDEALAAGRSFQPGTAARVPQAPPDWAALVGAHEPAAALAFCLGNFPQLVRNLQPLWQAADLAALRPAGGRPVPAPTLRDWASTLTRKRHYPQPLLAAGVLRLARHFDDAAELLREQQANVPAEWRAATANEKAALAWHRGQAEEAAALWQAQPESVPVLFNRGMAALFLGRPTEAPAFLTRAIDQLPEAGAWHHLGRLYLTLAERRER
jgi:hypothetical protein